MIDSTLSMKQRYQNIVLDQYKDAVFVTKEELIELHRKHCTDYAWLVTKRIINQCIEPCAPYVLGAGVANAPDDRCCNGIRYGENGDYLSFLQLPSSVWVPF